jgi:hypothetical protein
MHAAGQLARKRFVDEAVTLEPRLPLEGLGDDMNAKMRLSAWPMAGVTLVSIRFIDDAQALGCKRPVQFVCNRIGGPHRF